MALFSRLRPRLRTVLVFLNLLVLALPLAGIQVMRLYESALVRQTESELIAQAAFIAAAYRNAFDRVLAYEQPSGNTSELDQHSKELARKTDPEKLWQYRAPILDLVDSNILPPQPEPKSLPEGTKPDSLAYIIGQDLESILKDAQRMTLAAIRIVDHQGIVVATTGEDRYLLLDSTQEVTQALNGNHVSRLRTKEDPVTQTPLQSVSRTTGVRAFVAMPIFFEDRVVGAVLLSRTPANIIQALYAKRKLLAYAIALLLGVVILIAFVTSRTVVRPIEKMQELARRVSLGDERAMDNLTPGGTAEIAALGEQITEMGRSLEDRRRYVQEFARHVSHEFKTPLTALRGAIEMFEDHGEGMNAAQRQTFLRNMDGDVTHLHRLTNSLLQLAKADMQESTQGATTNLNELLKALAKRYQEQCDIVLRLPDDELKAAANKDAVDAALTQIIENSLVHGKSTTSIRLQLSRSPSRPNKIVVDVIDNGVGISPGNQKKVLQPFFTTAKTKGSTGLGLAIASRLIESQRGTIDLILNSSQPEEQSEEQTTGAHFRLEFNGS